MDVANWDPWQFLLGEWVGEGGGGPAQGSGGFTFSSDLQQRILVRRNYANYPATTDRPAYAHEDLMLIYQQPGAPTRAIYFDNEGHVINYAVTFFQDGDIITFLGEIQPSAPRFRFTYTKLGPGSVGIAFEIAPPGKPEEFAPYIRATAQRK